MIDDAISVIALELAILARRVTAMATDQKKSGLDRSAYLLLHQIQTHDAAGVKTLAEEFRLDVSTVSRQASALEQKGYIARIPDPDDGRAFSFHITAAGAAQLTAYREEREARIQDLLASWSEEELATFGRLLRQFNRTY